MGITGKLASAIVVSVLLAVAALLIVVYMQMSKELLVKSEEILEATMGETVQVTKAWLNRNLTMLEVDRISGHERIGYYALCEICRRAE